MNKTLAILALFATIISTPCYSSNNDEFVNPLFYKQLTPFSSNAKETHLTPTTITEIDSTKKQTTLNCKLAENSFKAIAFKCDLLNQNNNQTVPYLYKYQIHHCYKRDNNAQCLKMLIDCSIYDETSTLLNSAMYYVNIDTQETEKTHSLSSTPKEDRKDEFINPLFYKKLNALSIDARETYLTPTSLRFSNSTVQTIDDKHQNGWTTRKCRLLENKENYIVLKCETYYNPQTDTIGYDISKFAIAECFSRNEDNKCTKRYVIEYSYEDDQYSPTTGQTTYTVELD